MYHRYKNVADYIILADSKTCPLIKEYATAYFFARAEDIVDSSSSEKLQETADSRPIERAYDCCSSEI